MSPHRLDLYVEAERGSLYPCPECGKACQAHDFADKIWRPLNFFQHHCLCKGDQGTATLYPEGSDTQDGSMVHHELPQGHAGGGVWEALLKPMGKAPATLERHAKAVIRRWHSGRRMQD